MSDVALKQAEMIEMTAVPGSMAKFEKETRDRKVSTLDRRR